MEGDEEAAVSRHCHRRIAEYIGAGIIENNAAADLGACRAFYVKDNGSAVGVGVLIDDHEIAVRQRLRGEIAFIVNGANKVSAELKADLVAFRIVPLADDVGAAAAAGADVGIRFPEDDKCPIREADNLRFGLVIAPGA